MCLYCCLNVTDVEVQRNNLYLDRGAFVLNYDYLWCDVGILYQLVGELRQFDQHALAATGCVGEHPNRARYNTRGPAGQLATAWLG